jgi:hypothetical protein
MQLLEGSIFIEKGRIINSQLYQFMFIIMLMDEVKNKRDILR